MLGKETLLQHATLQTTLNKNVHPEWVDQPFIWTRAIMVEAVELLEHVGWKWWKRQDQDLPQAQLELVDIWHFILSNELRACKGDEHEAVGNLSHAITQANEHTSYEPLAYGIADVKALDMRGRIHVLIAMAAGGHVSMTAFVGLMEDVGLTWAELDIQYRAKNVLNLFRQDHGYKTGEYIKVWKGEEDNVVVTRLLRLRPEATAEQLYARLSQIYLNEVKQ